MYKYSKVDNNRVNILCGVNPSFNIAPVRHWTPCQRWWWCLSTRKAFYDANAIYLYWPTEIPYALFSGGGSCTKWVLYGLFM